MKKWERYKMISCLRWATKEGAWKEDLQVLQWTSRRVFWQVFDWRWCNQNSVRSWYWRFDLVVYQPGPSSVVAHPLQLQNRCITLTILSLCIKFETIQIAPFATRHTIWSALVEMHHYMGFYIIKLLFRSLFSRRKLASFSFLFFLVLRHPC